MKTIQEINKHGGGVDFFLQRAEFFKIGKCDFTFIREMRVDDNFEPNLANRCF